jgi:hypothetical protein
MSESAQPLPVPAVRAVQLALFDEDFALDDEKREFAHRYVATKGDGIAAVLAIRPTITPESARRTADRWLDPQGKKNAELLRYISWCRAQARLRAELTEVELIAATRRILAHALGDEPIAKTLVFKDGGVKDSYVREPSLSAANTAVEELRKLGGFGRDLDPMQVTATATATASASGALEALAGLEPDELATLRAMIERRAAITTQGGEAGAGT